MNTPERQRYQRLKQIVFEASRRPESERKAFLDRVTGEDPELRREAEELLAAVPVPTVELAPAVPAPAATEAAAPTACGPYRVLQEIGRGGMGVVYEAEDERDGSRVALKLLYSTVDPDRFEREADAGRSVDHPNVVRTLDAGTTGDQAYLALEYVEGRDLKDLLQEMGRVPESLLREIARQVSSGLEAVHGAGIIHRDLKPENILITRDQRLRIMDLGIAKLRDSSQNLTREGQFIGSLHYASPEQCDVKNLGPSSDLYSLGVVLYELATGRNPFRHDQISATLAAHLNLTPPPAHEVVPSLSSFFGEVLATLLAKRPEDRFPTAARLRSVLSQGEASAWWTYRSRARHPRRLPRVAVSRATRMLGREEELDQLRRVWDRAEAGEGGALIVEGEAGLGKSRLIHAFLQDHAREHVHVLYGSWPPAGGLRALTRSIRGKFGVGELEQSLAPYVAGTPDLVAPFAALVRGESGGRGIGGESLEAVFCQVLQGLSDERPVLWVLEDLHFAPSTGRRVAAALGRTARKRRALVLLTTRPTASPFVEFEPSDRLVLPRLTPEVVARIVREAEGDDVIAARVAQKAGGIPFFALELARSLRQKGEESIPSRVRDLIAVRLGTLSRSERTIVEAAAVQGFDFDADLVSSALEQPIFQVLQELAEVERRVGLVRAAGRIFRFDHHLIQELVYADLPERLRAEYHARLARVMSPESEPVPWVRHTLFGTAPEEALPHLDTALRSLENRYLNEAAVELMERAVPLIEGADRVRLLLRKTQRLDIMCRRPAQKATAEEAVRRAAELGDEELLGRARITLGAYSYSTGDDQGALEQFTAARDIGRRVGNLDLEAQAIRRRGVILTRLRLGEEAAVENRRALKLAEQLGDKSMASSVTMTLALTLRHLGRGEEAAAIYRRGFELAGEVGDRRMQSYAIGGRGASLWYAGRFEEGLKDLQEARRLGAEVGDRRAESAATGNLGMVLTDLGRWTEAEQYFVRHRELADEVEDVRGASVARNNIGAVRMRFGDLEGAREILLESLARSRAAQATPMICGALHNLGDIERWLNGAAAARYYEECVSLLQAPGFELLRGQTLLRWALLGDPDIAKRALKTMDSVEIPGFQLLTLLLARNAEAAAELLDAHRERMGVVHLLEGEFQLWELTGDAPRLQSCRRLLEFVQEHSPAEVREDMIRNVPLHRAITEGRPEDA